ncbi:hypothetical protein LKF67_2627 [Lactococcus lactis subsp. lactis]|nr:hypothetical protein LKF67_2627 [Lactococcus lactis subsp. lactis]
MQSKKSLPLFTNIQILKVLFVLQILIVPSKATKIAFLIFCSQLFYEKLTSSCD